MKLHTQLLALCVLPGTTAFFIQAPKTLTRELFSTNYLNALNGEGVSEGYATSIRQGTSTTLSGAGVQQKPTTPINGFADSMRPAAGRQQMGSPAGAELKNPKADIWDTPSQIILQGGSLRTWSETTGSVERVQVLMRTEGRPLNANVELWHGPDNTPLKMAIYSEDGGLRAFNAVIETPTGQNTIAIRNTGQMEFPLTALVEPDVKDVSNILLNSAAKKTIQGGAILTYPFDHSVASVQVMLKTGGRPLNARIELLQGPNNDKVVVDIYTEDGSERPFFAVIETPGTGNVVRIVNTASVEFPLTACVEAFSSELGVDESGAERGWDVGGTSSFLPWGRA